MSSLHGQSIYVKTSSEFVSRTKLDRKQFLNHQLRSVMSKRVIGQQELMFLGNDVAEPTKKEKYNLVLHGVLACGSKASVCITGILPYVVLRLNEGETHREAKARVERLAIRMPSDDSTVIKTEIVTGRDFMFFEHSEGEFIRVYFDRLRARTEFLTLCGSKKDPKTYIKTYSNDSGSYYRVAARDYDLKLSSWNILRAYKNDYKSSSKAEYRFTMDVADIRPLEDEEVGDVAKAHGLTEDVVKHENTIVASFDIEMIPFKKGTFPDALSDTRDSIFMIVVTFHTASKSEALVSICLTLKAVDPMPDVLVVHCADEACLLLSFAQCMAMMQPDFITEFNGGGFDWRQIIAKARHLRVLAQFYKAISLTTLDSWELNLEKNADNSRFHKERAIKIGGATAPSLCKGLKMQGFIGIDLLVVFKQLEPNEFSHSLNACLERCNLGSKDEMPIAEMFRVYEHGTSAEMQQVAHYCYIDTFKLQQLMLKKAVIQERREVANLSFTSLFDNFVCAGGIRMRNLLINQASKAGYFFDTECRQKIDVPKAKFPGAFVIPPVKGIVKPIHRLDEFLELAGTATTTEEMQKGYDFIEEHFQQLYHTDDPVALEDAPALIRPYIDYVNRNRMQYPVSGLDFASLYPNIINTYNFSPEKLIVEAQRAREVEALGHRVKFVSFEFCGKSVEAWFVQHDNDEEKYSVCGKLLIDLFDRRKRLKNVLEVYEEEICAMELEMKQFKGRESEYPRLTEYNELQFKHIGCDSKQKAVKVFMNTLYGEMGNLKYSFIAIVHAPGSVTTLGRYNLVMVKNFVVDQLGMKIYYGDTDSLYVACNAKHFVDHDRRYFTGEISKLEYGHSLVEETFLQIAIIKDRVNEYLFQDNGSRFLKMAYEEVLYPCVFLSKKKYFGVPHKKAVDFYPKKLFIRGLDTIKRGVSEVLRNVVNEIVREVLDVQGKRDIVDIVKDGIERIFTTNWPLESFAKTAVYRPDKRNISVITMMERYKNMNYHTIPDPNVRFAYVICKYYQWSYDIQGRISKTLKVGDCMELLPRVREEQLEVDLSYYFARELTGQLARLLSFHEQVRPSEEDLERAADGAVAKKAAKLLLAEKAIAAAAALGENEDLEFADEETRHQAANGYDEEDDFELAESDADAKIRYQATESVLFAAAQKFVKSLAAHYGHAYVNKGGLLKSTWRSVCEFIDVRKDIQRRHISAVNNLVFTMFANLAGDPSSSATDPHQHLLAWAARYILLKYQRVLDADSTERLSVNLECVMRFIEERDLLSVITKCTTMWKTSVVEFVIKEYDYQYFCEANVPHETLWDVMDRKELENILLDPALFPQFAPDHAMQIVDMVATAIGRAIRS